ncbi:MAG: beta-alanine--pyruvate transaminase [Actinobacteria bacterium]|jgi:hypothetical protein|nr:beta-alanine--pyruvate transaminase [Actinomycetota bacterium]
MVEKKVTTTMNSRSEKLFETPVADVYVHYVNKIVRKGQKLENLDEVITWLTGFEVATIKKHITEKTSFRDFFEAADINSNAELITGSICGVKIQEIEDPLMKKIRFLDKLVEEVAQGRPMNKILRSGL